ncbi:MAG: ATP-binding cassette domain-containing protein [Treponema sp.]|nr:ATP-binding cassette domain-containing protein [Treponema sp.]
MILELRDICLKFSHKTVLQKLNVRFEEAQLHALLGENGAGKSTAANIICGELQPDSGQILINGEPVVFHTPREAINRGICYVHQRPMLADSITVKENLLLGLNKEQKKRLEAVAQKWLADIELNSLTKKYGADTRFFIALTSALIKEPYILILDEPSALLDENQEKFLFENLKELATGGMNIIVITHNYEEAKKYCDTVDYLEDGVLVLKKELDQVRPFESLRDHRSGNTEKIKLITGLPQNKLDEMEKKLIAERRTHRTQGSLRLSKGPSTGFIPTDRKYTGSNPNLTIEQMLTAALDIPENQKPDVARKMIEASGVNIQPQEKCSCLSGGMLQKLMIEREFYNNPKSLILCNPLQGLDVKTCRKTCERIQKAAQEGADVLVLSYGEFPLEDV